MSNYYGECERCGFRLSREGRCESQDSECEEAKAKDTRIAALESALAKAEAAVIAAARYAGYWHIQIGGPDGITIDTPTESKPRWTERLRMYLVYGGRWTPYPPADATRWEGG